MSEVSQGQDWWLATDGKWYPPRIAADEPQPEPRTVSAPIYAKQPNRQRWKWVAVLGVVAELVIAGFALFKSKTQTSHSLSYRDGFVVGQKTEAYFAQGGIAMCTFGSCRHQGPIIYADESPIAKCLGVAQQLPNGLPTGDSRSEWVTGCTDGYNAATHPANGIGNDGAGRLPLALSNLSTRIQNSHTCASICPLKSEIASQLGSVQSKIANGPIFIAFQDGSVARRN
jgi:hypothetical protein